MRVVSRLIMIAAAMMLIIFSVAACVHPSRNRVDILEPGTYAIDPLFDQFVTSFGGKEDLGSAISLRFKYGQIECQYLQNALLCYDPTKPDRERFYTYPLGKTFTLNDDATLITNQGDGSPVDRSLIYNEFVPFFDKFGGENHAGKPLTKVLVNKEEHRVEQYFEKLGFYRRFDDPIGTVHLLSYGSFACADRCPFAPPDDSKIIRTDAAILDQPFTNLLAQTNNLNTFGQPLSPAKINSEKKLEQVYEAVVIVSMPGKPSTARLLPLPIRLHMTTMPPGPQTANEQNGVIFYPVDGNLGYHVPLDLDKFIRAHGGYELSGKPIAEIIQYQPHIFRQCFTNYCLDYLSQASEGTRVRMAKLGPEYQVFERGNQPGEQPVPTQPALTQVPIQPTQTQVPVQPTWTQVPIQPTQTQVPVQPTQTQSPIQPTQTEIQSTDRKVVMQVNESYPRISASSEQTINLLVLYEDDGTPVVNVGATLLVTLADGKDYRVQFPPTGIDGKAVVQIPAMPGSENATLITYEVCLDQNDIERLCATEGYLIWKFK